MRAAIIHYWLLNMCGGEKVVEALPEADLFTLFYRPGAGGIQRIVTTVRVFRKTGGGEIPPGL